MADYDPLGKIDEPGRPRTPVPSASPAAVTWVELPPDAPEPPPLSVVRDVFGMLWFVMEPPDRPADERLCGVSGENAGDLTTWAGIQRPLTLGQPEGVLWPLVESVEPSPYEVRHAALAAAVELYYGERDDPAEVIGAARAFEGYLRDGGPGEISEAERAFLEVPTRAAVARALKDG